MGGCRALPSGERLRCGEDGRTVRSDSIEVDESIDVGWRSLSGRFGGRARLMLESDTGLTSCKYDDADDLSERKLDCQVSAVLVNE